MKKFFIIILSVSFLVSFSSCRDLDLVPLNDETDASFWDKPEDALNALNHCYGALYRDDFFFYNETLSDNAFNKSGGDGNNSRNIAEGSYDPSQSWVGLAWDEYYKGIRRCNILLANIDKVTEMDESLRERIKGEARFIRASLYFNLITWYGDVPLVDKMITVEESLILTRTPQSDIVAFINSDLDFSASVLPSNKDYAAADRGRITKGAALALKARLALYTGQWQEVVTLTERIMNGEAGTYSLFGSYSGLFRAENEYNDEVILDLQYALVDKQHSVQRYFIPKTEGNLVTSIAPTQELVDAYPMINGKGIYEPGSGFDPANPYANRDPRFYATIVHDGFVWKKRDGTSYVINTLPGSGANGIDKDDASPTGYYFVKYYDPNTNASNESGLNLILIRYADVLLMYAEAKFELGQMNEEVWNKTIRKIRERAGYTDASALQFDTSIGEAALENLIRNERRVEFGQEGLRIFDIRRWKTAEVVLNGWAHGMKVGDPNVDNGFVRVDFRVFDPAKHYLWPIPQKERDRNKNLTQNPNW